MTQEKLPHRKELCLQSEGNTISIVLPFLFTHAAINSKMEPQISLGVPFYFLIQIQFLSHADLM